MGRASGPCLLAGVALAFAVVASSARAGTDRDCFQGVCIEVERSKGGTRFFATNRQGVPTTVEFGFPIFENMKASVATPVRRVVPADSRLPLLSIEPRSEDRSSSWRWQWRARPGVLRAKHDDRVRYRLPWSQDERFEVGQGVGGRLSHRGKSHYSFDFPMPVGTVIRAARGGTVVEVIERFRKGGADRTLKAKANSIQILHDDGTLARYVHLRHAGAIVEEGAVVRAGDPIGYSGNTGYSTHPHLHFTVFSVDDALERQSLDIRFDDGTPAGFVPVRGQTLVGAFAPE